MEDKKTSVLALLSILKDNSDEAHPLSQPELLSLLDSIYHVNLDRRTLYKNVEMLQNYGYDISTYSENGKGYYLRDRDFEPSQVSLLCNAIHSSNFIPSNSSKEIINKLLNTQSKYFRNDYKSTVYIDNKDKKDNKEFFYIIEIISEAIRNKKTISFSYTKYDINKKVIDRRQDPYIVSPYYLVYKNEKTYLIGKTNNHSDLTHFRVDRIRKINISKDRYIKLTKQEDPYEYARNKIHMYHGDDIRIAIRCNMTILDDIIDIFGKDINIIKHNEDTFDAYVKSSKQGMIYLALQYLKYMEVIEPKDIRNDIKKTINDAQKKYR